MAGLVITVKASQPRDLAEAWRLMPQRLLQNLAEAYAEIGRGDIEALKSQQLRGGRFLNIRNQATLKAFKFKASDPGKVQDFRQLFVNEYTRWPAAAIHAKGGTIKAKRGSLWILTINAKGSTGKRRFSDAEMRAKIATGQWLMFKIGDRMAVVDPKKKVGGVMAIISRSVRLKDRLDWEELIASRNAQHVAALDAAAERTIAYALGDNSHG